VRDSIDQLPVSTAAAPKSNRVLVERDETPVYEDRVCNLEKAGTD
jgi:hypothetical protein